MLSHGFDTAELGDDWKNCFSCTVKMVTGSKFPPSSSLLTNPHCVGQAGLLLDPPGSAFPSLGFQVYTTVPA